MTRRSSRSIAPMEVFDNEVVPPSLGSIVPILRVANEIEVDRPRAAYLCRFYAYKKAYRLDPNSTGRGVRQFKFVLLQRLERDNAPSLAARLKNSDAREMESFHQQYYEHYVTAFDKGDRADRAQLGKAYQTAGVLFEVLCDVNQTEKVDEFAPEEANKNKNGKTPHSNWCNYDDLKEYFRSANCFSLGWPIMRDFFKSIREARPVYQSGKSPHAKP